MTLDACYQACIMCCISITICAKKLRITSSLQESYVEVNAEYGMEGFRSATRRCACNFLHDSSTIEVCAWIGHLVGKHTRQSQVDSFFSFAVKDRDRARARDRDRDRDIERSKLVHWPVEESQAVLGACQAAGQEVGMLGAPEGLDQGMAGSREVLQAVTSVPKAQAELVEREGRLGEGQVEHLLLEALGVQAVLPALLAPPQEAALVLVTVVSSATI